jgi:hypothetical protein
MAAVAVMATGVAEKVTAGVTAATVAETAVSAEVMAAIAEVITQVGEAIIATGGILRPEITGNPGDLAPNRPRQEEEGGDEKKPR